MFNELPLSVMSAREESGHAVLCSHRRHALPSNWPSPISRFLDSSPARPRAPKPSAGHAHNCTRGSGGQFAA